MQKTLCIFKARIPEIPYWDPDSIHTGVSGSEECIIYSAQALKNLGFKVFVLNNIKNKEKYSNPSVNPCYAGYLRKDDFFDITILHDEAQFTNILRERTEKLYFLPNNPCREKLKEDEISSFDDVLWISSHQRNQWVSINPALSKFTKIFGNALNPNPFKPIQQRSNPYSCIYASDYARGLYILLNIWPTIKKKFPQATLDIYYGLRNWGVMSVQEEQFIRDRIQTLKTSGVTDHGQVGHEELTIAFSKASLWTYPCTYPETFCITAIKAQLSGAIPVIIEKDALAETVKFGFKCARIEQYEDLLLGAMNTIELISIKEREQMGKFILEHFTWDKIASKWSNLFF
jgi:glycosyltransferase involved in cell wall biosynthesis